MNTQTQIARARPREQKLMARSWLRLSLPFSEQRTLLMIGDALLANAAVLVAMWLWAWLDKQPLTVAMIRYRWMWFPLLTCAWWICATLNDLYAVPVAAQRFEVVRRIVVVLVELGVCYLAMYFVLSRNALPRLFFLFFSALMLAGMIVWRWAFAAVFTLPQLGRRVLIVGAGWAGLVLAQMLSREKKTNYRAVGFVDDDPLKSGTTIAGLPVLGTCSDLVALVRQHQVDEVVVAITHNLRGGLLQALMDCRAMKIHTIRMPDLYEQLVRRAPVEHVNESWVLDALNGSSATYLERIARRLIDLFLGLIGLLGLGAIVPFVALASYLDDRGPLFYTQVRSGQGGRPFRVIKFRTMDTDAEKDGMPRWAQENDSRATRVGRFLRKFRLDELPQVINVLRGEMSIVGPRPERPEFIVELEKRVPFYRSRLVVKPGLTGWAQVCYEYGNSVQDALIKLEYDLYYIRHRSIWLDLYIIFQTASVVLRGGGM